MWSELTYLIERRCRELPADVPAARAAMALYGALGNCEIAFERVEAGESDADRADAALAIDALLAVLHNVQSVLGLLDSDALNALDDHLRGARWFEPGVGAKGRLKSQVGLLRRLLALEAAENDLELGPRTAFTGARRELARFMLERYSSDLLFASVPPGA